MELTHEPTTLSESVVKAVAERAGVRHDKLDRPLYDAIDADALDTLFRNSPGEVTFQYSGYWVTVDDDGSVTVSEDRAGLDPRPADPGMDHPRRLTSQF